MSKEDLHQDEEDTSKPHVSGSESEDEDDDEFEELLSKFENDDSDEPVTREELNQLKKAIAKGFSDRGRKAKEEKKEEPAKPAVTEAKASEVDDLTEMFLEQNPKVELVKEKLDKVAKSLYGGSIIKAWRNEPWLREMADSIEKEKSEEAANKAKVGAPSKTIGTNKADFKKMPFEEAKKLSDDDFAKWSEANQ